MDFARKQLEKYGWTDGKGLGKHENGISQPLKPKIKRSVTGVGHDPAADFTEHWWTTLYNKAAGNLEVKEKDGKTKKIKEKDADFEITNSTWKLTKKAKKNENVEQYSGTFIKTAVLTNGGVKTERVKEEDSDDEKEKKDAFKMTDEELFAACEGRTAHKGARHGLKASGKLARIQQQEEMLLFQPQFEGYTHAKKLKQKKVKQKNSEENSIAESNLNVDECLSEGVSTKQKKKKETEQYEQTVEQLVLEQCEDSTKKRKTKKKKKCKSTDTQEVDMKSSSANTQNGQAKMLENKRISDLTFDELNLSSEEDSLIENKNKRKQKRRLSDLTFQDLNLSIEDDSRSKKEGKRQNDHSSESEIKAKKKRLNQTEAETEQEDEISFNDTVNMNKEHKVEKYVVQNNKLIVQNKVATKKKKKSKS